MSIEFNNFGSIKFRGASDHILTLQAPTLNLDETRIIGVLKTSIEAIDDDIVLLTESGSIIPISKAVQEITLTLPPAVMGLHYIFVVQTEGDFDCHIDAHAGDRFDGYILCQDTNKTCTNSTRLTFLSTVLGTDDARAGDSIEFVCYEDNRWIVLGFAQNDNAIEVA